jgi:hypothetical protein
MAAFATLTHDPRPAISYTSNAIAVVMIEQGSKDFAEARESDRDAGCRSEIKRNVDA